MTELVFFIILATAIFLILAFFKGKAKHTDNEVWPLYAKKPLSQPEQILYFRLIQALPDHIVLAQVQLSRFLGVKKGNNYQAWLNRINRMSADFVICNKDSSIVAVIELDDSSHQKENRKQADAKKNRALSSAGIQLIRWGVKSIPDASVIKSELFPNLPISDTSRKLCECRVQ